MEENIISESSIVVWFDVDNVAHIIAYEYLQKHGTWPEGFIPANVDMVQNWQILLINKMANRWIRHKAREK